MMVAYDVHCGGLGPRAREEMNLLASMVDPTLAGPAALTETQALQREGKASWCGRVRPIVRQMEPCNEDRTHGPLVGASLPVLMIGGFLWGVPLRRKR
jgi:hypothetical protein